MLKNKTFKIYQVDDRKTRNFGFMSINELRHTGTQLNLDNYNMVFVGAIESQNDRIALEQIFEDFNINHPLYYNGRSISIGDIVEIDGLYYYCDMVGWWRIIQVENNIFVY